MPTDALESILYRDLSKVAAKECIDLAAPLLQELVHYGTHALARCANTPQRKVDEDLAILVLYRHIIEVTDGIEVLISACCPKPAIPLLRSSFEALLAIEYIVENEQDYERRALSWLVGHIHRRLAIYDRLDPSTQQGREFARDLDSDRTNLKGPLLPIADIQKARTNLQHMLSKPHLQPIEAEFRRQKGTPNWYRLFGGPHTIQSLARHLQRGGQYAILYRSWSASVHAQDANSFIDRTAQGETVIRRIRDPDQLREIASTTAACMLAATRSILGQLRPGENVAQWYIQEVQERFLALLNGTIKPDNRSSK